MKSLFFALVFLSGIYLLTATYLWRIEAIQAAKSDYIEGSLSNYFDAQRRAESIGGCWGWSEGHGRFMAWPLEHPKCQEKF